MLNLAHQNITYALIITTLAALVLIVGISFILRVLRKQAQKSKNTWDDIFILSITLPIKVALGYAWLYVLIIILSGRITSLVDMTPFLNTLPLLLLTWAIFRLIDNLAKQFNQSKTGVDSDFVLLSARLGKIFLGVIIVLIIAQYFGFSITSVLTFGGMGGLIIGFAAKDMLANIFGGLMLHIDKPFSTGDWIRAKEHNIEGVVAKIGWRMTQVITFSKNPIYVPNALFSTTAIETPSRMSNRRIRQTIGVRYDDISRITSIIDAVKNYLTQHPEIDTERTLIVNLNNFNAYSVDFFVYAFTKTTNWAKFHHIKQEILLTISDIISKHGGEIAYPTQVLKIDENPIH